MHDSSDQARRIDVRRVPPHERHPLIFSTFDALQVGDSFEIVNDHDPMPLQGEFGRIRPGQWSWASLESGPSRWQVRITRVQAGSAQGLPRGCGGGGTGGCGCSGG